MAEIGQEKRIRLIGKDKGKRLDLYLSECLYLRLSRSRIEQLIEQGNVFVDGRNGKPSYKLKGGEEIEVIIPPPPPIEIKPEQIEINIVYEDEYLAVVEKPFGMLTHPVGNKRGGTLVNALLFRFNLSSIGSPLRPGIVHRLDRDTGGLLIVAKTDPTYLKLAKMIREKQVDRHYIALVHKEFPDEEKIVNMPLMRVPHSDKMIVHKRGKEAKTILRRIKNYKRFALLEAILYTGRTHQVRVHCAFLGHPIVGDTLYAPRHSYSPDLRNLLKELNGQALYAYYLSFLHPFKNEHLTFHLPLPLPFQNLLKYIESL